MSAENPNTPPEIVINEPQNEVINIIPEFLYTGKSVQ
jgi:hypothetical protein